MGVDIGSIAARYYIQSDKRWQPDILNYFIIQKFETMKRIPFHIAVFAVCLMLLSACKKDNDAVKTRAELLTSRDWQLYKQEYDDLSDAYPIEDEFPSFDACSKDDYLQFLTGGTGFQHEGPTKCDAADPDSYPFYWQLQDNDNKLVISGLNPLTILRLDEEFLHLELVEGSEKIILYFREK